MPPAHLRLTTQPWAQIFLDGRSMGFTPSIQELPLTPGRHSLRLVNPYFKPHEEALTTAAGETRELHVALEALPDRVAP